MRVFISGPMRGVANYNFGAFDAARDLLIRLGHQVVTPADLDRSAGFVTECDGQVVATDAFSIEKALRQDFAFICVCDAIAFLPGWCASTGSLAERRVAIDIGCGLWRVDPVAQTFEREMVIGLSGYARSGKDTAARCLLEQGFVRGAFADKMKTALIALDPYIDSSRRLGEIEGAIIETPSGLLLSEAAKRIPEVRRLLQRLGTEAGRKTIGEDVWVRALLDTSSPVKLVITDVRFPNEASAIRALGGLVIRIERPGVGPINDHESEVALDGYDVDVVIDNDGTVEDLATKMRAALAAFTSSEVGV